MRLSFSYDRGGEDPPSLCTLQLFDASGFRGAAHRFAPEQTIEIDAAHATPGFVPGPIGAGDWMVELDVHSVIARSDGKPNAYSLVVESAAPPGAGAAAAEPITAGPVGVAPRHWLRGELHLHSEHSDGRWTTGEMAERAKARSLDFLFLTDHNTTTGVDILRAQLAGSLSVLPGIELTTYHGHALALGASRWIDWRTGHAGRTANQMAESVRAAGAFFVVAHPDAPPDDVCTGCRWSYADFDPALAHAVEVWGGLWNGSEERNQGCLDLWRDWLNRGLRMTATGATDAHRPEDWDGAVPLTYVEATDASLASVLDALHAGRTYVSSGPALEIQAVGYDGPLARIGESIPKSAARAIEAACASAPVGELRLVAHGEILAKRRIDGEGYLAAAPRASDRWCCAELWSEKGDILLAVTSPIYLT